VGGGSQPLWQAGFGGWVHLGVAAGGDLVGAATASRAAFLDNCYPELVRPGGNKVAQLQMASVMRVADATWRGIGVIPRSGLELSADLQHLDAAERFPVRMSEGRKRVGEMPPGCACADVVLGRRYPDQCVLYGRACTPRTPVGPCMVSDEGACRIWWAGGIRTPRALAAE
jgi:hydrogenase expression/formation protein HypD